MKLIFAIIASIIFFLGFFPYLKDIHNKRVQPHLMSWIGWGVVTLIAFFAMLSDVFNWGAFLVLANSIGCFAVVSYSIYKKTGVFKTNQYDIVFFVLGIAGVILWQTLDNPDIAILSAIIADISFGIPTIIKTYKNPSSETRFPWGMAVLSGFFGLLAVSYISFTEVAYPVYLFIYDLIIFLIIIGIIRKIKKKTN